MVIEYLNKKGMTYKRVRRAKGFVGLMNCPFCDDKESKFAISLVDGAFNCLHNNKCGVRGSFHEFQQRLGDVPVRTDYKLEVSKKEYKKPDKKNVKKHDASVIKFFADRKISEKTIEHFKICLARSGGAVAIPYFFDGDLINIKYRSITEKKFWHEKDCELKLYNIDNCNEEEWLIILEGEMDVLAAYEYGINAVSVPNGTSNLDWVESCYDWLNGFDKILIGTDHDKAGEEPVKKIADRLGRWRCYRLLLPKKDMNDCLMAGISKDIIMDCIVKAEGLGYNKIKAAIEYKDSLIAYNKNPERRYGTKIGFKNLQNILKGWREGELTVWSGRSASGKTNFLNEIIIDLANKNQKCFLISLEMSPERILSWMTIMLSGIEAYEEKHQIETTNFFGQKLYLAEEYDQINSEELFDMMKYSYMKYGVKHFFIDNLIGIEFDYEYLLENEKTFTVKLRSFARLHQVHVHLVVHPRKGLKDTDKPDKVDVGGSGHITDVADNLLILYRYSQEQKEKAIKDNKELPDNILFVKKNREWGYEFSDNLLYSPHSKRFVEAV